MGPVLNFRTIRLQSRGVKNVILNGCQVERQLLGLPWAADSCPWVGKLRTVLPLTNRVIRDSAVQLGLTHQRGAIGVDSSPCSYLVGVGQLRLLQHHLLRRPEKHRLAPTSARRGDACNVREAHFARGEGTSQRRGHSQRIGSRV
jgi:hypothetical protein